MKVMLLFPPHWTPAMPHLALPALSSFLRARGVNVVQRDLNLEVYRVILTRSYLDQALARLRQDYGPAGQRRPTRPLLAPRDRVQWALAEGGDVAAEVEGAVNVVRSDAFLDDETGLSAFQTIMQGLEIASLPYFPAGLSLTTYMPPEAVDSSRRLRHTVSDPRLNIFLPIFRQGVLGDIKREQPDIIGISIVTREQMLAGMTLAYLIKQSGVLCHVTVGGPHISMLREQLPGATAIWEMIDSAVVFEGEQPLLRLAEALDGGDLSRVPNLIYKDGAQIRTTPVEPAVPVADLPTPDFDGLPLDRYLSPRLILPLLTARGCYHGRCGFCNVGYGSPVGHYHPLAPERVIEQMLAVSAKYGTRHIFFADEAMSPRSLRAMSAALEQQGAALEWCGCARFEKAFTPELLQSMVRGGCRMLLFGLESASPTTSAHIGKNVQIGEMARILEDGARAGIWNHTFFFFGFPGETMENAQETANFVYAHGQAIHSGTVGTFVLECYSPAHLHPERYGIRRFSHKPENDLAIYFDYEVESGMDEEMADQVASALSGVLPQKRFAQYYASDAYRFLYASRLRKEGKPLPGWLTADGA